MKKTLGLWRFWIVVGSVAIVMGCRLGVWAQQHTINPKDNPLIHENGNLIDPALPSNPTDSNSTDNELVVRFKDYGNMQDGSSKLTATDWNKIMDLLDKLNNDKLFDFFPEGTIMAFDLNKCPDGWLEYVSADGKFLMGTSIGRGDVGSVFNRNNKVVLTGGNIPQHRHYLFGPYVKEGSNIGKNNNPYNGYLSFYSENGNPEQYQMRGVETDESKVNKGYTSYQTDSKLYPDPIDITNSYVKVLYCIKGGGVSVRFNSSSSDIIFTVDGSEWNVTNMTFPKGTQLSIAYPYVTIGGTKIKFSAKDLDNYNVSAGNNTCGSKLTSNCSITFTLVKKTSGDDNGGGGGGGGCFLEGTDVLMENGETKNIEDVEVGDIVLSYNTKTKRNEYNKVVKKFIHDDTDDEVYELTIDGHLLKTTKAHRFYVVNGEKDGYQCTYNEWIAASHLKVGDTLLMSDGKYVHIDSIEHYPYHSTFYNLGVENANNYYVDNGYLVHNSTDYLQKMDDNGTLTEANQQDGSHLPGELNQP